MAETLNRQLGETLVDITVVLFLFILRVTINALCVKYTKRMSGNASSHSDVEFDELEEFTKCKLPQLKSASEIFVGFLTQFEKVVPFLIHINVCLFPRDFSFDAGSLGNLDNSSPVPVHHFIERVLAFRLMKQLDWSNCCMFQFHKTRAPVVQNAPVWSLACTAAFHAAFVKKDVVQSSDFDALGPHFVDWSEIRRVRNGHSMMAIPLYSNNRKVIGVLDLASRMKNAFKCEATILKLATLLEPFVDRFLHFSTRKTELQLTLNSLLPPVAACMQPSIPDHTCYTKDINRGKVKCRWIQVKTPKTIKDISDKDVHVNGHLTSNGVAAINSDPSILNICVPCYAKQGSAGHSFYRYQGSDASMNWGAFLFNLVNLCFVYVYLSKVAIRGHTCMAVFLCFCVGIFDVVLLVIRHLCFDHSGTQGAFILGICQIYRVIMIPVANTWMSWRVFHHLELQLDFQYIILLALGLLVCLLLGSQVRFLLQVPLQLLSIILTAMSTPEVCHRFVPISIYPFLCVGMVSTLQVFVAYLIPTLLVQNLGALPRNGEFSVTSCQCLPQMQAESVSC